jgi:O-antigen/teichoic acid export membrane protein
MTGPAAASSPAKLIELDHAPHAAARRRLERRTQLAWLTSLASKVGTFGTQLVAVPAVYRTLGQDGYAAYAAVTSAVSILGALNLGIGGSLVTPIAQSAALGDRTREGQLFRAGLLPLSLICLLALVMALPAVLMIPLPVLLGKVAHTGIGGLRSSLVVACVITLASLPLTLVGSVRQAYQELHITNLLGAVSNGVLCAALLAAAQTKAALPVFVACFAGIPLAASILNGGLLLAGRRYLLAGWRGYQCQQSLALVGDGVRFLAAAFSSVLVYQWPIYVMAHSRPAAESAAFAISMQFVLLPLSFVAGVLQPFWGTTAEAAARGDLGWVKNQVTTLRRGGVTVGLFLGVVIALWGGQLARLWLGKPVALGWGLRVCAGAYLMLAVWEYLHFVLCLGSGRIREASTMAFARSAAFAVLAPWLVALWGGTGVWAGLCGSVLGYTAWRMPRLLGRALSRGNR